MAGAASLLIKVEADPFTADVPTDAVGLAAVAVEQVAHAIVIVPVDADAVTGLVALMEVTPVLVNTPDAESESPVPAENPMFVLAVEVLVRSERLLLVIIQVAQVKAPVDEL